MTGQYPDGYLDQMMFRVPAGRKGEAHCMKQLGRDRRRDRHEVVRMRAVMTRHLAPAR